ncbi:MFS general substrate transporter [Epithele typhae]|uniref:MFS general substrate transporter n=1 Tax=Epithele typhae TaxID=378194 RepID=UPI0020073FE5|nr:MFS general substrate transporter [Epithele typhae]KAH9944252.1 MFS general substrate transporter [Epithele typhae]
MGNSEKSPTPTTGDSDDVSASAVDHATAQPPDDKPQGALRSSPLVFNPANLSLSDPSASKPYSVYTSREKWFIVAVTSFAAMFSPLTANIYFPAIPTIALAFNKSTELINLTVTVYMVIQGVAPMFWGTLSDRWGRRPMFVVCLLVLCVACVGLALVPTDAYWFLMLFRCLQAAGSASTIALGAGVIADIAAPAERGNFFGMWSIGPMVGPCVGPILGGVLADKLGWRSIFWFLVISSGVCALVMILLLPETLRAMVGDGSIPPPAWYKPVIPVISRTTQDTSDVVRPPPRPFQNPLLLFLCPDVTLILLFNALVYAEFYAVIATISVLFQEVYPYLNETETGLCFLPIGIAMLLGGIVNGKISDREYQRIKRQMIGKIEADPESTLKPEDVTKEEHFPIERARLRLMPFLLGIFSVACIGYGWALQAHVSLAGSLVLQFIIGWTCIAIMNNAQTLIVDLVPEHGSAITACNNLVRCCIGAVAVSVIDLILKALRPGWTYVLLTGICVLFLPVQWVILHYGPIWRAQRRARKLAAGQATLKV